MTLPSLPFTPEAALCMQALDVIDEAQCRTLDHPLTVAKALIDLSFDPVTECSHWHLSYLPKWYEIASKGLLILTSHISSPGLAIQVRTCLNSGLHGLVRCTCQSKREAAALFLSNIADLLAASQLHSAEARASLFRITSCCRVPSTRVDAIKALASHAPSAQVSLDIRRSISHVARYDTNASVRAAARASLSGPLASSEDEADSSSSSSW